MEERTKGLIIASIVILLIWFGVIWYAANYAEYVKKDPCSVCAKKMGTDVVCTTGITEVSQRIYYVNGSIGGD